MGLFDRMKKSAEPADEYASLGLPASVLEYVKMGDERLKNGETYDAIKAYFMADMYCKHNLVIARRFARTILSYEEDPTYPNSAFDYLGEVYDYHTVEELTGEDFELMAKALYRQIVVGKDGDRDKRLAPYGFTTAGYLAKCIDDARYLGVDVPEFKEMEQAVAKGTEKAKEEAKQNSSFFNRKK